MDDIMFAEENVMSIARREMVAAFSNTFVLTADESGVIMFERMLNIVANSQTEDLEFRRQRILNRMSMSPPFTFRFLKQKLDEIIGVGAWTAYIDFDNYTLYVESSASDQNWHYEVTLTINRIKPCNMVFVNVPRAYTSISMDESISYRVPRWRYRLGSWKLGQHPFATMDGGGVIKMSGVESIKQPMLNDIASFVAEDISYALINDTVKVTQLNIKQAQNNVAVIEYAVTPAMTTAITNIKLVRADNVVLTEAVVYVPVTETVINKHIITMKEGA
jgi:hypothetical protein